MRLSILKRFHLFPHVYKVVVLGGGYFAACAFRTPPHALRCQTCTLDATQPGHVDSTFPQCSGGKRATSSGSHAARRIYAKSEDIISPPNFRKANLRCDAGLLGVSSLSLFFCSAQDAVLALHAFYRT